MLLPSVACEELRSIIKAQTEYRLAHGKDGNVVGLVLPKRDDAPMSPSTLKSMWWTWAARRKVQQHLPVHGLRDQFGTWVYETHGVKQAQEWLGHGDPATTLRRCVRLTTAVRAKAVTRLDEATLAALEQAEAKAAQNALPAPTTISGNAWM